MKPTSALRSNQRGGVYVEFLLVFPPLFVLFLVILQWSILGAASLGVKHAASHAARSSIVVLPDDPVAYDNAPPYFVPALATCSEGVVGKLNTLLGKIGGQPGAIPDDGKCTGGPRMAAIRFAAISRMIPFAPNARNILPESMAGALDAVGDAGWLVGASLYSYGATSVNFPQTAGSEEMRTNHGGVLQVDTNGDLTVRVNYLAHCGIPIARFLMCDSGHKLGFGVDTSELPNDVASARQLLKNRRDRMAAIDQLARGTGSSAILTGLLMSGERFMVLRGEATLPINAAPYSYKEKR